MSNLLYLVHRLPYPPDKGDKVRSYHLLEHLRARHRVFVGTFVDDPADRAHLPALRERCAGLHAEPLDPRRAKVASLAGLVTGDPLTLRYYRSAALRRWVQATVREQSIDAVVVFSSSMAPYAEGLGLPVLVDLVDVDSAKWADYAPRHRWPLSWLYRREGERLLAYERDVVARAAHAFLVTDKEVALFEQLAPECRGRVEALGNGVDAEAFAPDPARPWPFAAGETPLVFTGAMDYWPNVDAVTWFAHEILPQLRERHPAVRLHVVGRNPAPAVRALASDAVAVSGTVPDVRPYLQHAAVVVAPLRLARGIQNKVLEAMAMGRPVVAASSCVDALGDAPTPGMPTSPVAAADADGFVREVDALLRDPARAAAVGAAGRERVRRDFGWAARLSLLDRRLASAIPAPRPAPPAAAALAA